MKQTSNFHLNIIIAALLFTLGMGAISAVSDNTQNDINIGSKFTKKSYSEETYLNYLENNY